MARKSVAQDALEDIIQEQNTLPIYRFASTGSVLLNLAISGKRKGGYPLGRIVSWRGLSHAGKSLIALTALAEAAYNPEFDDYDLIINDAENAYQFDTIEMFGEKLASRLIVLNIHTAEEFYVDLMERIKNKKKFIYVNDSYDALTTQQDDERYKEIKKSVESEKEVSGTYAMGKAKFGHEIFRNILIGLMDTESVLVLVSQSKVDVSNRMPGTKYTVSGGASLDYCPSVTLFTKIIHTENKDVRGTKYPIWIKSEVATTKNRVNGKKRKVNLILDYNIGVDDIRSCIHYLMDQGEIKTQGRGLVWGDLEVKELRDPDDGRKILDNSENNLILMLENDAALMQKLFDDTERVWTEIEHELKKTPRRSRYAN